MPPACAWPLESSTDTLPADQRQQRHLPLPVSLALPAAGGLHHGGPAPPQRRRLPRHVLPPALHPLRVLQPRQVSPHVGADVCCIAPGVCMRCACVVDRCAAAARRQQAHCCVHANRRRPLAPSTPLQPVRRAQARRPGRRAACGGAHLAPAPAHGACCADRGSRGGGRGQKGVPCSELGAMMMAA